MIKDNRINKNNGRNTSYYKSKVDKTKKKKNNFSDRSRRRQMNSYIRAVSVVAVFMFVVAGFIALGVYLKNLTAEESEPSFASLANDEREDNLMLAAGDDDEEPGEISEIYENFRGVYLDVQKLEDLDDLQNFIDRVKSKEINAVTIDIKKEDGIIPYKISGQFTAVVGEHNEIELKIQDIIEMLRGNHLYVSGRIACFKDSLASMSFPVSALAEKATGLNFTDAYGSEWLNLYSEDARNYIKNLAAESVRLGFDEIVLDYFYLPNVTSKELDYNDGGVAKNDAVKSFVTEIRGVMEELAPGVRLGLNFPIRYFVNMPSTIMGLNPNELMSVCDFFTTSFAPSELPAGAVSVSNPESSPYESVKAISAKFGDIAGKIMLRPDLQAFEGSGGMAYGSEQIMSQRQALLENGISVWTIINYNNDY